MFRFLLLSLTLVLTVGFLASPVYDSPEGRFTVDFPSGEVIHKVENSSGADVHIFLCVYNSSVYMVGYSDFGMNILNDKDRDVACKAAIEGFLESVSATGTPKSIKYAGLSGYEVKGSGGDTVKTVYRSFMKKDRLYQIGVLSDKENMPSRRQLKSFFKSLVIR